MPRQKRQTEVMLPASLVEADARASTLTHLRLWQPGQSGNPKGLPRAYFECRRMLRDNSLELTRELIALALTAGDERVKSVCLIACLDRSGIKPMDYDPNAEKEASALDLARLSPHQRQTLRELLQAAVAHPNATDTTSD